MSETIYIPPQAAGAVSSVFGRTGAIVATSNDYTFAQLSTKPTTLSGYGITDAVNTSTLGANNGVATLDSGGKLTIAQLPTIPTQYKGTWNANTNTPTLANGVGTTGDFYYVGTAGTTNFGAGGIAFVINDVAIYNGTIWQKVASTATQVNSDWTSGSGFSQILNKPTTFSALGVQIATNKLLGNNTGSLAVPQEITIGTGLSLSGSTLSSTGIGTIDTLGGGTVHTITYGASITFDDANGTYQKITLTGNTALTLSHLKVGIPYHLKVIQDGTGSRTMTISGGLTTIHVAYNGLGAVPISTNANAYDIYHFLYDGTTIDVTYDLRFS